jgi:hypothetical protein
MCNIEDSLPNLYIPEENILHREFYSSFHSYIQAHRRGLRGGASWLFPDPFLKILFFLLFFFGYFHVLIIKNSQKN